MHMVRIELKELEEAECDLLATQVAGKLTVINATFANPLGMDLERVKGFLTPC
jgi:hypothetical protein